MLLTNVKEHDSIAGICQKVPEFDVNKPQLKDWRRWEDDFYLGTGPAKK